MMCDRFSKGVSYKIHCSGCKMLKLPSRIPIQNKQNNFGFVLVFVRKHFLFWLSVCEEDHFLTCGPGEPDQSVRYWHVYLIIDYSGNHWVSEPTFE